MKKELNERVRVIKQSTGKVIHITKRLADNEAFMQENDLLLAEIKPLEGIEPIPGVMELPGEAVADVVEEPHSPAHAATDNPVQPVRKKSGPKPKQSK